MPKVLKKKKSNKDMEYDSGTWEYKWLCLWKIIWQHLLNSVVGLKLNIQKTKIMASSPIISQQIDGETMETLRDYFGGL